MPDQMLAFFEDGMNERGYVAAARGMWPAVHFEFRPMLTDERAAHWKTDETLGGKEKAARDQKALQERLISWSVKDRAGEPVDFRGESGLKIIRKLRPGLFQAMWMQIMGLAAPDEDPDAPPEQTAQNAADKAKAAESGAPFRPGA